MYISKVVLRNYRNFKNSKFEFKKGINTIIGENGAGKTNLFRAIRLLLDDYLPRHSINLSQNDFNRSLLDWKGHWIIISIEFSELSNDEAIQALFTHGVGNAPEERATYNLIFRPKKPIRLSLYELDDNDIIGMQQILNNLTINDYETIFTGKSSANFNDNNIYNNLVGDFENVVFPNPDEFDEFLYGAKIPNQLSVSNEISFTFIKALRDVVSDFNSNKMNPLLNLLKNKSENISEDELNDVIERIRELNTEIENLSDIKDVNNDIHKTIKEAVGQTYAPSSLNIKSSLSEEPNKFLQSLQLLVSEPNETYEGAIHELSLGGANLIFLTLKLLEFKYQRNEDTFANFLLIEEPEAHIHTHVQKTLFENLNYEDTQIIYSTHSTHISDVSKISNMNILAKKINYVDVYQPSKDLLPEEINKLERYLDAIRSNLLFAKGVILVEGDAEAIVIPNLVKKVLGVSLDELGISLISVGSTGFKNIAQIFHNDRIKRKCAIITDLDSEIADTTENPNDDDDEKTYKKKMKGSHDKGANRKQILDTYVNGNIWLKPFYATHTFEVDFILNGNVDEVKKLAEKIYTKRSIITTAKTDLSSGNVSIYGKRILTMAGNEGKGWIALLLAEIINVKTKIPDYILNAIKFVNSLNSEEIQIKIIIHRIKELKKLDNDLNFSATNSIIEQYLQNENHRTIQDILNSFNTVINDDQMNIIFER